MKYILFLIGLCFFASCTPTSKMSKTSPIQYLEVPENRTKQNGKSIQLAYTILEPVEETNKEPIVVLQGGPGGPTLFMTEFFVQSPLHQDRAIIFMDQRGSGKSNAISENLGTEIMQVLAKDYSLEEEAKEIEQVLDAGKAIATKAGYDFSAYNSRENAADFEALRKHLGYEQWNLFGGSYGSRLGLTIMRDFPEGVRSAIFSGVFGVESNLYADFNSNFNRALTEVFEGCKEDANCNAQFSNLKTDFFALLNQLQTSPYHAKFRGQAFVINAQDLMLIIHQLLYGKESIAYIPVFIKAFNKPKSKLINEILEHVLSTLDIINLAMYLSVNTYEEIPFNGYDSFQKDLTENTAFPVAPAFFSSIAKYHKNWHPYRAPKVENQRVVSDIPVLLLNGQFDPITPPSNAESANQNLSNGYTAEFKGEGHNFFNACFMQISSSFLNNKFQKPDFSCTIQEDSIEWKLK